MTINKDFIDINKKQFGYKYLYIIDNNIIPMKDCSQLSINMILGLYNHINHIIAINEYDLEKISKQLAKNYKDISEFNKLCEKYKVQYYSIAYDWLHYRFNNIVI